MSRVVHFEIPSDNPEKTVGFYEEVFGWKFNKWDGPMDYWLIETGEEGAPGINGGLMKRQQEAQSVVNTIDVPSVDAFIQKVTDAGGTIAVPKMAVPSVGYLAYFLDTEGNMFGIMEQDESVVADESSECQSEVA